MKKLTLILQTPEQTLFDGTVDSVKLVTELGEIEVFPEHADLAGAILFSRIYVKVGKHEEIFLARLGTLFVENSRNIIRVLVQFCVKEKEVDHVSLQEYRRFIQEKLANSDGLNQLQATHLEESNLSLKAMDGSFDVLKD